MNINGLSSGFQVYAGLGTQTAKISADREKSTGTQATTMDTVEISSQARSMVESTGTSDLSRAMSDFMDGAGNDGVITLDEILAYGKKYQEKAEEILAETLDALGFSSNEKITICSDAEGNIVVSSNLSGADNEKLEQALNDHPDFRQDYAKAASSFSFYDAGIKHSEFAKAYENNPEAAVSLYGLGNNPVDFVLEYLNGESRMVQET
ncbi:MAG: hypothetical protein MI799_06265 [Desulfobacterales bacterium]|nr:hypothetical protein [Desulfobacterales bacterium]